MRKLSFIIPMYNCERYIASCLDSILKSGLQEGTFEIIVVNDGSSDGGPAIAQEYAGRYGNVRYLTQENQGQSVARNYGLREAESEYIWFIDGDDKLESSFMDVNNILSDHPTLDILAVKLQKVTENGEFAGVECSQQKLIHNVIMSGRDAVINGYDPSSVCALIIRRQLMLEHNLRFYEGITHQDVELSYRLMSHAASVYFSDIMPYVYILHPNSTSQSVNPQKKIKYLSDEIIIIQSFNALADTFAVNDAVLADAIRKRTKNILFGMVLNLHKHKKEWASLGISKEVVSRLKVAGMYPVSVKYDDWKKNLFKLLLNQEWFLY